MRNKRAGRIGLAVGLVLLLVAGAVAVLRHTDQTGRIHVTAYFENTNGTFAGDQVRILGVPVGKIDRIEPQGTQVKVTFWYDRKYKVPNTANAVILSPSLVTARAIQLTPAYTGGSVLADDAVIPRERTAVPVEWDDFRAQLQKLAATLQPTEPGGVSTLGSFINTSADNLRGQGANIHDTIVKLSQAFSAVGDHSKDLFSTVKNLSILVSALQSSEDLMRRLNQNFSAVTGLLSDDPNEVGNAVADIDAVADKVRSFVADNKEALGTTSDKLASVSTAVNQKLDDIKQLLHLLPNTLQNFANVYQPAQGTLTAALGLNNFANPIAFLCSAVQAASRLGAEQSSKLCVQYLAPILKNRQWNFLPLGENLFNGASARPNELTYSEDWLRPDYVPPPGSVPPPAGAPGPDGAGPGTPPTPPSPLAAEAAAPGSPGPSAEAPSAETPPAAPPPAVTSTNPSDGLSGLMTPPGGGS